MTPCRMTLQMPGVVLWKDFDKQSTFSNLCRLCGSSICEILLMDTAVLRGLRYVTVGIQLLFLLYKINQHNIAAESVAECEKVLKQMQCF